MTRNKSWIGPVRRRGGAAAVLGILASLAWIAAAASGRNSAASDPLEPFLDGSGAVRTYSTLGPVDGSNPFFQVLGTNGRACVTCHVPATGWTLSPTEVRARFDATGGLDPLFRTNDGSTSPFADVSTVEAREQAYALLLDKGLIRVGMGIPAGAEFTLESVDDPYGFASASELSLFRRPLPSTNLPFLSSVMWDGRETFPGRSIAFDLMDQANGATLGHAQAAVPLTAEQQEAIVRFETSLYTAQVWDRDAGDFDGRARVDAEGPFPAESRRASNGSSMPDEEISTLRTESPGARYFRAVAR